MRYLINVSAEIFPDGNLHVRVLGAQHHGIGHDTDRRAVAAQNNLVKLLADTVILALASQLAVGVDDKILVDSGEKIEAAESRLVDNMPLRDYHIAILVFHQAVDDLMAKCAFNTVVDRKELSFESRTIPRNGLCVRLIVRVVYRLLVRICCSVKHIALSTAFFRELDDFRNVVLGRIAERELSTLDEIVLNVDEYNYFHASYTVSWS